MAMPIDSATSFKFGIGTYPVSAADMLRNAEHCMDVADTYDFIYKREVRLFNELESLLYRTDAQKSEMLERGFRSADALEKREYYRRCAENYLERARLY